MDFKKQIVPTHLANRVTSKGINPIKYIILHQTGNTNKGANAQAHANIQSKGNSRKASWHESIDDKAVIQSFEHTAKCWHAGDGSGKGNGQGIGLELCINSDGDYKKTIDNGAKRTAQLMKEYKIPLSNVLTHRDCNGKNCPAQIYANVQGISWADFKAVVSKYYTGEKVKEVKPAAEVKPSSSTNAYTGNSIVDYLKSIGEGTSYGNRQSLAKEYGVIPYSGTAGQNLELLERMRNGATPEDVSKDDKDTADTEWTSVVDYLNAKGRDSSFGARQKLAKQNGINPYRGTAQQNIQLLNKLTGGSQRASKSIEQMAREVAEGKHGNGHANRQKSLGVDNATYQKVRARVNQLA